MIGKKFFLSDQYMINLTSVQSIPNRYSTIHKWTRSGTSCVNFDWSSLVREFGWSGQSGWSDRQ